MPISVTRWMNFANRERPGEIHPPYWHLMQDQAVSNQAGACWPLCELLLHCCPQKPVRSHCICSLGHWGTNKQRRWPQGLPQLFCRSSDFYLTTASSDDRLRLWQAVEIHSCQKGSAAGKAALALTERKGKERAEAAVNCWPQSTLTCQCFGGPQCLTGLAPSRGSAALWRESENP